MVNLSMSVTSIEEQFQSEGVSVESNPNLDKPITHRTSEKREGVLNVINEKRHR